MKNKQVIFWILSLLLLIVLGVLINSGTAKERNNIAKQKETAELKLLFPDLDVEYLKAVDEEFLDEEDTKIIKRYDAYDEDDELIGIIYIGETKGYKEGLQVAFGINTKTNKITNMKIMESNETETFLNALNENFYKQFKNKDLNKYIIGVDVITGATPNGGNGEIAPYTSAGIEKVMLLARLQYSQDTDFKMPSGLTFVSKELDYTNIDQFIYNFKLEDTTIKAIVNKNYEIISIDDESQKDTALEIIKKNKFTGYIDTLTTEDNKTILVISSADFSNRIKATITIEDSVVTDVNIEFLNPDSYGHDDYPNAANEIKNDQDIVLTTGATASYKGLKNIQEILREFLEVSYE